MSLTSKQEKFCQCIASGMSQKDSYIAAYDTKASDQVIYNESSKLMLREDIQQRIKNIIKPLEQQINITANITREKQIQSILDRIEICKNKDDEQSLIRYYDMLNKILGIYRDNPEDQKENKTNIKDIDTNTLIKLVKTS